MGLSLLNNFGSLRYSTLLNKTGMYPVKRKKNIEKFVCFKLKRLNKKIYRKDLFIISSFIYYKAQSDMC